MALSESELDEARVVAGRIRFYEFWRKWWPLGFGWSALIAAENIILFWTILFEKNVHDHPISPPLLLILAGFFFYQFRRAKKLYSDDIQLLEKLRDKAGGRFPPAFEVPVDYSLLRWWSRKHETRAILWRMDQFLSGNRRKS